MIRYYCKSCGSGLSAPERLAGQLIPCAVCGHKQSTPSQSDQKRGKTLSGQEVHEAGRMRILSERYTPRETSLRQDTQPCSIRKLTELEKNQQFDRLIQLSAAGKIAPGEFKALAQNIEKGHAVVLIN